MLFGILCVIANALHLGYHFCMSTRAKNKQGNRFSKMLHDAGMKATPARIAILEILDSAKFPLSPAKILKHMPRSNTDQATVYRTLNSLRIAGKVRQIDLEHGHAHFEMAERPEHHHVVCTNCGKVADFEGCVSDSMIADALKQTKEFASIDHHALELFGLCKTCAKKMEKL